MRKIGHNNLPYLEADILQVDKKEFTMGIIIDTVLEIK